MKSTVTVTKVQAAVATVASMPPVVWLAKSAPLQRLAFSPHALQMQQLAQVFHSHISDIRPMRLAEHYATILATMAVPSEKRHNISITGLHSRGRFHLLRRHPDDDFEARLLDNATGHVHNGDSHEQTARREVMEETGLPVDEMLSSGSARLHDMGNFGWLMHLRTPRGREPAIVYGKMFFLDIPDVEAHHITLKPDEHTEVVTLKVSEIMANMDRLCTWDSFFFNTNLPRIKTIPLRQ